MGDAGPILQGPALPSDLAPPAIEHETPPTRQVTVLVTGFGVRSYFPRCTQQIYYVLLPHVMYIDVDRLTRLVLDSHSRLSQPIRLG